MVEAAHFRRLPLTVQTAYADLLARLQENAILELGGTPVLRERGGRKYWYSVQRLADHSVERYLGPDREDVRAKVERARKVNEELKQREKQRGRLARMCREGGLPRVDAQTGKVLLALSKAGIFRLRGVIIGTHAFRCYPGLLGVEMLEAHAVTEDIDLLVELLTRNEGPDRDEPLELPALGAYALPLRFLDYLIHEPAQAVALYRSGTLVNVPQPARYAIHKLIVATRRISSAAAKARKDIEQSATLIRVLAEDRPDELEDAFAEAHERGPSWREAVDSGARRLPSDAKAALGNAVGERVGE